MIKLFKNVFLIPSGLFLRESLTDYDVLLLENPAESLTGLLDVTDVAELVGHNQTYRGYVNQVHNGDETAFFEFLAKYQGDRVLAIYASKTEFAKLLLRFLVDLYPRASLDDIELLYVATLDKISMVLFNFFPFAPPNTPESRHLLIEQCYLNKSQLNTITQAYIDGPLGFMDYKTKVNLAFEWLYFDYLLNGVNSEFTLQLIEQTKAFLFPHLIVLHDAVCSMNNLAQVTNIPLQLTYHIKGAKNTPPVYKSEINSAQMDVAVFVAKYASYVKSAVEDEQS